MGTKAREGCWARRTWGTVARDWRGSKGIYREWSKLRVELLLPVLNCDAREREEKSKPAPFKNPKGAAPDL